MINEKIRAEKIHFFLMKYVTLNGKALKKDEWKKIKRKDKQLYKDLLSEECDNKCYIYSLEIARMFEDSILIWGAVHNIFSEKEYFCAHAVILRNGYVYDSNIHQSIKYEEYQKLFKLKVFKKYTSCEYLKSDFRVHERVDFRKWCKENNVIKCELF